MDTFYIVACCPLVSSSGGTAYTVPIQHVQYVLNEFLNTGRVFSIQHSVNLPVLVFQLFSTLKKPSHTKQTLFRYNSSCIVRTYVQVYAVLHCTPIAYTC